MESLSLNDLDNIDESKEIQKQINQLDLEIRTLATRLAFPPSIHGIVGGTAMGGHVIGGFGGYVAGAALGYFLSKDKKLSDVDRQILVNKIRAKKAEINELNSQLGSGGGAVNGIMNSQDLVNYKYKSYKFGGEWKDLLGQPYTNFHMMIFGSPKQGKSILAVQFAKYLSENFGEVLYVASEEGFSATLQSKVRDFSMANGNLDFANFREYSEIEEAVTNGSYDFLFIDSVNYIRMSPEDVENLKKVNKRMAIITIQQATKDGKYKGDTAYAHNCDIIVKVKEGVAFAQGRFAARAEMAIFDFEETEGNDDAGAGLGDSDYQTYDDR
jgi:hypothetical protein